MNENTVSQNSVNWSIGYNLRIDRKPLAACANKAQRRGWRDAELGERACMVMDAVAYCGGDVDSALAEGWWR